MEPMQRLEEELFCLSSWLSLNRFEEQARRLLQDDFRVVISSVVEVGNCITVGSTVTGLYVIASTMITRMLPNSNVDFIVSPAQMTDVITCEQQLFASLNTCNTFYNVQLVEGSQVQHHAIEAIHSVCLYTQCYHCRRQE